jgi:hypothetical protein
MAPANGIPWIEGISTAAINASIQETTSHDFHLATSAVEYIGVPVAGFNISVNRLRN